MAAKECTDDKMFPFRNDLLQTFIPWSNFLMDRNKSFRNILKRIGPNIEPCGIPDKMFCNALKMLFVLRFCF